jgi:hypothetical protein
MNQRRLSISAASLTRLKFLSSDLEWRRPARLVNSESVCVLVMWRKYLFVLAARESIEVRASDEVARNRIGHRDRCRGITLTGPGGIGAKVPFH